MASPPRGAPSPSSSQEGAHSSSIRSAYRDHPTPHPSKFAGGNRRSYFDDGEDDRGHDRDGGSPPAATFNVNLRDGRRPEAHGPGGVDVSRESSHSSYGSSGSGAEAEEGVRGEGGRRRGAGRASVVSEIIRYGLRHGIGGGFARGRPRGRLFQATSTASLYEDGRDAGDGWDKGKNMPEPDPFSEKLTYREKDPFVNEK